jgi:hypothetical protein
LILYPTKSGLELLSTRRGRDHKYDFVSFNNKMSTVGVTSGLRYIIILLYSIHKNLTLNTGLAPYVSNGTLHSSIVLSFWQSLRLLVLLQVMGFFQLSSPGSSTTALKWLGFVAAVWVQAISGNNYTFSNYSDALKSLMNLTQLELNNLSVAKDVGKAFGLLAGLASDKLPTWLILLIGSVEGLVGYGAQWLVVSEKITLSYWQVCLHAHYKQPPKSLPFYSFWIKKSTSN